MDPTDYERIGDERLRSITGECVSRFADLIAALRSGSSPDRQLLIHPFPAEKTQPSVNESPLYSRIRL